MSLIVCLCVCVRVCARYFIRFSAMQLEKTFDRNCFLMKLPIPSVNKNKT